MTPASKEAERLAIEHANKFGPEFVPDRFENTPEWRHLEREWNKVRLDFKSGYEAGRESMQTNIDSWKCEEELWAKQDKKRHDLFREMESRAEGAAKLCKTMLASLDYTKAKLTEVGKRLDIARVALEAIEVCASDGRSGVGQAPEIAQKALNLLKEMGMHE